MSRDIRLYLEDIVACCAKVTKYVAGSTFEQFVANDLVFDAVVRNIEIIGEAVKHLPDDLRLRYPSVPWQRIAGTRDYIVHGYFGLDSDIIWDVAINKVPALQHQVESMLRNLDDV